MKEKIMKEKIKKLLDQFADCDITLVPHQTFLALSKGGVVSICPTTRFPCNSSCIFFSIQGTVDKTDKIYRVTISCRTNTFYYVIDLS